MDRASIGFVRRGSRLSLERVRLPAMLFSTQAVFIVLGALLLFGVGCSKEKKPQYTSVPVTGYPYPFGISVKSLLGRAEWSVAAGEDSCRGRYRSYRLQVAPQGTAWSQYSTVILIADSLETLQAFSATRGFNGQRDIEAHVQELLPEIRRRYGAQTDSTVKENRVLGRSWRDVSGNSLRVETEPNTLLVQSVSARLRLECPEILKGLP